MAVKVVIFDLDGTITEPFFDFDVIREQMGLARDAGPVLELMEKMTPEQRESVERILYYHEQQAIEQSRLNPGAEHTLDQLRQRGIGIGVLTRNRRENALAVADRHGLQFDIVLGRDDGPPKPDAFGVRHICEHFSTDPSEAVVVGDYLFDLLCAKAAGAHAILLANQPKYQEFKKHADFVVENIDQIIQIVDNINNHK